MNPSPVPNLPINEKIPLPQRGSWPKAAHLFDEKSVWAIRAAIAAQRPLLVRGEPGTGKSQLARAAAEHWQRLLVTEVIHARTESQDLQWRYDAIGRLGNAQALAAGHSCKTTVDEQLNQRNYLSPGALWWVFDWLGAEKQHKRSGCQYLKPQAPDGWSPEQGSVLLIDEIDKADADLPNGLLETLGNGAFSVPWLDEPVGAKAGQAAPLVIITTNEERELPAAFVRRCLVLNLGLPTNEQEFIDTLVKRGRLHFENQCHKDVYPQLAGQLWADRQSADAQGMARPGQAEYIDLLRVLANLQPDLTKQLSDLEKISEFALQKYPRDEQ